mmetsp:Transcript_36450/g.66186  ORF Transcript_36450/g.66186 Transcript_36450/m.66186 type:complete len:131 (-) Transcript_36450:790-1182(-)
MTCAISLYLSSQSKVFKDALRANRKVAPKAAVLHPKADQVVDVKCMYSKRNMYAKMNNMCTTGRRWYSCGQMPTKLIARIGKTMPKVTLRSLSRLFFIADPGFLLMRSAKAFAITGEQGVNTVPLKLAGR